MKEILFSSLLIIICYFTALAQNIDSTNISVHTSNARRLTFMNADSCLKMYDTIQQWVKNDFVYGEALLLIQSGIAPTIYSTDKAFENKYGIRYHDYGCIAPDKECILIYNYALFDQLEVRYDKSWRKEIRKDVMGLKEWKRKK